MENLKLIDCKTGEKVKVHLLITKILDKSYDKFIFFARDTSKEVKCLAKLKEITINVGDIILAEGRFSEPFKIDSFEICKDYDPKEFLLTVKRPIEDIMKEIDELSKNEFKSEECIELNKYFFENKDFVEKFKMAIGGVSNHHNYLGGLAEHTLGVMYLSKIMAYRYDARYKEIAILGAKLHDIGKIYEMFYEGSFRYTLKGSMEGHIVIGVSMIDKAFEANKSLYTEEFKERIKGIIVQHHGKLEYGSPIQPRSEEAYIVHYADYIDATMNKIKIISSEVSEGEWSNFDKRIEGRLYL